MIPPSHQFRIHKFGAAAPWVDLANSEMWDGYGRLTDFLNDPQWIQRLPGILAIPRSVARDLRFCSAISADCGNCCASSRRQTSRGVAIQPRDLEALNSWLKVPVFRRLVEDKMGCSSLMNPYKLAGRRCCGPDRRFSRRSVDARLAGPVENMRQYRLRVGVRGPHEGESSAMV